MVKKLTVSAPYEQLLEDIYSLGIFDKKINGLLEVIETNKEHNTILAERKFIDKSGNYNSAGYYFIQCLNELCKEEHLKEFRGQLEKIVKQKSKGNYKEVDPILISPEYSSFVLDFITRYNKIQRRKPIQLYSYGN